MIQKMKCPGCEKGLYSTDFDVYGPCPYCGFVFNWKLPDDKKVGIENKNIRDRVEAKSGKVSYQK